MKKVLPDKAWTAQTGQYGFNTLKTEFIRIQAEVTLFYLEKFSVIY